MKNKEIHKIHIYKSCNTFGDLQDEINDYLVYYNQYRCQWGLKKMTPEQFRNHLQAA
ncbi:IS3 family transposase [Alkalicella caledoniensis]|uniref:IS3 family transposase n=1 Tax=Alkalicella caledoniensis TaxID=2731377 RepID=A0A7G9W6Q8_ALKCA|nr:IS3 family transposase [Alkalicella caledoniensis]QNO14370.1 IS3 family transposase [Alkalicella caledoniensis]